DHLYVVSRGSKDFSKANLIKSSTERVSFDLLYQVKGGVDYYKYRREIENKIEDYIKTCDFAIIRVPSTMGIFAYKLCKKHNKPYVVEVVGCAWDSSWNYGSLIIKLQAPLLFYRMRQLVRQSFA